jgi:hypothetical protein
MIKDINKNLSETTKQVRSEEDRKIKNEVDRKEGRKEGRELGDGWDVDKDAKKPLSDLASKAKVNQQNEQKMGEGSKNGGESVTKADMKAQEELNKLMGDMGLQGLTPLFKPQNVKSWKKKLEKLLDIAWEFDVYMNPNRINRKIEDAPPGAEDDVPTIKNVVIMLDCSASMGYDQFIKVSTHLSEFFKARKMRKTKFHVIPFGSSSEEDIKKMYGRPLVGSSMVLPKMKKMSEQSWHTDITAAFLVLSKRVKRPDAVLILTDGELNSHTHKEIAVRYTKKHRRRLIWILTPGKKSELTNGSTIAMYDPKAFANDRYVVFTR